MANEAAIKRRVEAAKRAMEEHGKFLLRQHMEWRDRQKGKALAGLFPSTEPGSRQYLSPLGGEAAWPWGRKKG